MRAQLQKFTEFASQLLPHETTYLLSIQQFADADRLRILQQVDQNCQVIDAASDFDISIDKRKYNHLQNWIRHALDTVDVDVHFEWLNLMEQKIMTDSISLDEENELLGRIKNYQHPIFYFKKFYELAEHYRQFLLIRIRYTDYQLVHGFLIQHEAAYQNARAIYEKLHEATRDIVGQYSGEKRESIHWEEVLTGIFYNQSIDGLNRYLALVRLIFISFNYGRFEILREKFDYLDGQFAQGRYYSKRLLLNYYNNRLLFHSHFREYERAVYFGYLSIRSKNHDYIHYVNNLCAVLLRLERYGEALELMKKTSVDVKDTGNMHSRVGFASFYLQAMNKNQLFKHAENYGDAFLKAFDKEVLKYRWHLFFSFYLQVLLNRENYTKLHAVARKFKLLEKDRGHLSKANYLPTIPICMDIASYKEGLLDRKALLAKLTEFYAIYSKDQGRNDAIQILFKSLQPVVPEVINYVPGLRI
ncbi:MAG: hypothetical protein IPL46_24155 [Saprospiraceae bacterium]|nr:hypothetical protein [Saprospiraceae bacterium]